MAHPFAETRLKSLATHATSPPPSVAKTRNVRKLESVEKPAKRRNSFRDAKRSSD